MKEVTRDQFYTYIGPRDIVCRPEKDSTIWQTRDRQTVGKSTPGYMCRDETGKYTEEKRYFLSVSQGDSQ